MQTTTDRPSVEQRLLEHIRLGEAADFDPSYPGRLNTVDGPHWDCEGDVIPAEAIVQLCSGKMQGVALGPRGIVIRGKKIQGDLNLSGMQFNSTLRMQNCSFSGEVILSACGFSLLDFSGSLFERGMRAEFLTVTGQLLLTACTAKDEVRLTNAKLGGDLDCSHARFENDAGAALDLRGAAVIGRVYLNDAVVMHGEIVLVSAKVGVLDCTNATLRNPNGVTLRCDGLDVGAVLLLRTGFSSEGIVRLYAAKIGIDLDCSGGSFLNPGRDALIASRVNVKGRVALTGCTTSGEVRFVAAVIGGELDCSGAGFDGGGSEENGTKAFRADQISIGLDMNFIADQRDRGFSARGEVILSGAKIGGNLNCSGAQFDSGRTEVKGTVAIRADQISVGRDIEFTMDQWFSKQGFSARGEVMLSGATIGGNLDCSGGSFDCSDKETGSVAINAAGINVGRDLLLRGKFAAKGQVFLHGARIGGDFDCSEGTLENRAGPALHAERATIAGILFLSKTTATGGIRLLSATVGGNLECAGSQLFRPDVEGSYALLADSAIIKGSAVFTDSFVAEGGIKLQGARIGGNFDCFGARFSNPSAFALEAPELNVDGRMILGVGAGSQRFEAEGAVWLSEARIGLKLECAGASIWTARREKPPSKDVTALSEGDSVQTRTDEPYVALIASGISVGSDVILGEGFTADGPVELPRAKIGGDFVFAGDIKAVSDGDAPLESGLLMDGANIAGPFTISGSVIGKVSLLGVKFGSDLGFNGAELENASHIALDAGGSIVARAVFCEKPFRATGRVSFSDIEVKLDMDCTGAVFKNPKDVALDFEGAKVGGRLNLESIRCAGVLNLSHARVGRFQDDAEHWPATGKLRLDGFEYDTFAGKAPLKAKARCEWIRRQGPELASRPQPYEQLIRVLRRMGHDRDARQVAIAKREAQRRGGEMSAWGRIANLLLKWTVAYGYKPQRALAIALATVVLGTGIFSAADEYQYMRPSKKSEYYLGSSTAIPGAGEATLLVNPDYPAFVAPVYSLEVFLPVGNLRQEDYWSPRQSGVLGWLAQAYVWVELLIGWTLTTVLLAALSGLIKRE